MESYHDAPNPWIPRVIRIDRPASRDDHRAGPHLVGCCAHAGLREVALRDCGRAIGGAHRLVGCRPVSRCGKYVEDVPLIVEHCEADAAEIDVTRRWLGEQGRRGLTCFCDVLTERHGALKLLV